MKKQKLFSMINIFGLAVSLTAAIFIFQYAGYQLSFDQHFNDHQLIYRVMNDRYEGDQLIQRGQITYSAVGPQLSEDYPEVAFSTTLNFYTNLLIRYDENKIVQDRVPFADANFFNVFEHELLAGNKDELLKEPLSTVLTISAAEKLIGPKDSPNEYLDEVIYFHEDGFKVVGVIADIPQNSSLVFDILLSRETLIGWWGETARFSWTGSDYFHYLRLEKGADAQLLESKLEDFSNRYFKGNQVTGTFEKFHLQPLAEVHLDETYEYETHATINGQLINILMLIAFFILIMAWVNYINLTTSRSLQRAKEVGMRKVVGASIWQLRFQFLQEAVIVNLLGLVLAVTIVQIFQQQYNQFTNVDYTLFDTVLLKFKGVSIIVWFLGIFSVGTIASASYPAFVLSKYMPVHMLKGNYSQSSTGNLLRKSLVVFQFILSTSLIAFTVVVTNQTNFIREYDLGYNTSQVLNINGPMDTNLDTTFVTTIHAFINELESNSMIEKVGVTTAEFGEQLPRTFNVRRIGSDEGVMLNRLGANYGFFEVYNIDLLAGRSFRIEDHNRDGQQIDKLVLNDKARELLGFQSPADAVNKKVQLFGREFFVIGVTDNFHFRSVKQSVEPILFLPFYEVDGDTYHIRYQTQNTQEVVSFVSDKYDEFFPGDQFEYGFMDAKVQSQYEQEVQFGKVFSVFSFVGISIACLGLVGLVGYSATKRTKEIGVRKVLGASVLDILKVISVDFLFLIGIATLLALPIIYIGARNWLNSFQNRIELSPWFFLFPVLLVFMMAVLVIISQTMKTAQDNPVNSLRED
ncbi:FtsX-like permease family protein [Roseivirga sp. UBA1976]|uniref:ABC transporter permease n=1 Tax=Roseivirga sp. UBA1976 TaxID=1947386 RepID=UPI00257AFD5E|nr:FtsX-like permease family protein [Roseivirga sp. UBA1976]MEC7753387.1 FtsX-like permease family protein [Bacteroidota bacterium]